MFETIDSDKDKRRFLEVRDALRNSPFLEIRDEDDGFNFSIVDDDGVSIHCFNFIFRNGVSISKEERGEWKYFLRKVIDNELYEEWEDDEYGYIIIPFTNLRELRKALFSKQINDKEEEETRMRAIVKNLNRKKISPRNREHLTKLKLTPIGKNRYILEGKCNWMIEFSAEWDEWRIEYLEN